MRQAIEIRNAHFRWDADRFVNKLREVTGAVSRTQQLYRVLFLVTLASFAAVGILSYQFGWFWFPPPEMRAPPGFEASEFRLNSIATKLPGCDPSPEPEPVPINSHGLANLALLNQATATASSVITGFSDRHRVIFLNDGWYNNCRSWIPNSMPAWLEIDLGSVYEVHNVRIGSEHSTYWNDRSPSEFAIRLRADAVSEWTLVYQHNAGQEPVSRTEEFSFGPRRARDVRIDFTASRFGDPVRVDEVEIYGERVPKQLTQRD